MTIMSDGNLYTRIKLMYDFGSFHPAVPKNK